MEQAMFFERLLLQDFRNYEAQELQFYKGVNLFYGDNAQGKTNLLEALFLFASGRSPRTSREKELIRFGCEEALLKTGFFSCGRQMEGEIRYFRDKKKQCSMNGIVAHKLSDWMGYLNVVFFGPENLTLLTDGPQARRHFLDLSISQLRPNYYNMLQLYQRVLMHRNALIKKDARQKTGGMIEVFDDKLSILGADIMLHRLLYLEKLQEITARIHRFLTREREELEIRYAPSFDCEGDLSRKALYEAMRRELEESVEEDFRCGFTQKGPHRDDMSIRINGREARQFGSQGQKRTAVISLKLSEIEFVHEDRGEYPVVLLDDIMSELDRGRQSYLMEFVRDKQVFVTDTQKDGSRFWQHGATFFVENGRASLG